VSAIAQRVADDLAERLERQIADLTLVIETTQHAIRELELELENRQRIITQQQARIDAYLKPAKDAPWRKLERYAVDALMEAHTLRNAHRKTLGQEAPYRVRQHCAVVLGVALNARNRIGDVHRMEKTR
jgi:hypothetical protein